MSVSTTSGGFVFFGEMAMLNVWRSLIATKEDVWRSPVSLQSILVSTLNEILDELGVSQYRLAKELGVSAMQVNHVVRGQRPLNAELALRLGRYLDQSPRYWLHLQSRYDIDVAEDRIGSRVMREVRRSKAVA